MLVHHLRAVAQDRRLRVLRRHGAYRAYSSKGLTTAQVAVCSITFALGVMPLDRQRSGVRASGAAPRCRHAAASAEQHDDGRIIGIGSLLVVAAYVAGPVLQLPLFRLVSFGSF